jgi:hypothetical protein
VISQPSVPELDAVGVTVNMAGSIASLRLQTTTGESKPFEIQHAQVAAEMSARSPISSEDDTGDDLDLYSDQNDAASFIQPAISPVATRLTSPTTPATEKAAAMDGFMDGFDGFDNMMEEEYPSQESVPVMLALDFDSSTQMLSPDGNDGRTAFDTDLSGTRDDDSRLPQASSTAMRIVIDPEDSRKSAMSGALGGHTRHQRSSSVGENALRKLSKAIPSLSIPTNFFSSIQTPSFLSTAWAQIQKEALAMSNPLQPSGSSGIKDSVTAGEVPTTTTIQRPHPQRQPSITSRSSIVLRRSASDDSLRYNSLSRVSSFGDDERFANIRGQVNVRFKALMDSWDGPSFKLPQINVPSELVLPGTACTV